MRIYDVQLYPNRLGEAYGTRFGSTEWGGVSSLPAVGSYYYFFLHEPLRMILSEDALGPNVVEAMTRTRPAIVIYDKNIKALGPDVQRYIKANYAPTFVGAIWRRLPHATHRKVSR